MNGASGGKAGGVVHAVLSRTGRHVAGPTIAVLPSEDTGPDNFGQLCQTWHVAEDGGFDRARALARELNDCRARGIDRLDVRRSNQEPIRAQELERLAEQYAEAQHLPSRGRIAQIRDLLHASIRGFRKTNRGDAGLIQDLFFGDDNVAPRKLPTELLKQAQAKYGERSDDRFREIRNLAFGNFAQFLIDFVETSAEPSAPAGALVTPDRPTLAEGIARPTTSGSPFAHARLAAVMRFSLVDPGYSGKLTIEEHQKIIDEHGRCWWGWFRSAQEADHSREIERRFRNCEIGLWERSEDLFFVARCSEAIASGGRLIESPDMDLTPAYYHTEPYPAWLSFTSIRDSSRQEFMERFGEVPSTSSTIYWRPEPVPQPLIIPSSGAAILHVSDLSFGQHHRWSTVNVPHRTYMTTEQAVVQTLLLHDIDLAAIGVVVICGNFVSDKPSAEAFEEALAFINDLCEQLPNVSRDHVVVVPGADDFARPEDREQSVQTLYRDFHRELYGVVEDDITRMRRYEFEAFRLNVLPVNSVKMLGIDEHHDGLFGYGHDSQLNLMRQDYLHNHGTTRVVNVVTAHHHIVPTLVRPPEAATQAPVRARVMHGMHDARDVLSRLSASRVTLYLHGHLHEADCYIVTSDDGWQTVVCCPGTAGASDRWLRSKYRDNHGNSLALIQIEDDQIRGRMFAYSEELRHSSSPIRQFEIKDQQARILG